MCGAVGSERVTLLLHRYKPHSVNTLVLLVAADQEERAQALYAADMSWLIASMIHQIGGGGRFDVESPSARYRDVRGIKCVQKDTRTEQQIADDVIAALEALPL